MKSIYYSPIRAPQDVQNLIDTGAIEGATLDFKQDVRARDGEDNLAKRLEFVRDVAQFANAAGGTIMIGFADGRGTVGPKRIGRAIYLTNCDARRDWMHTAIKDFAVPNTLSLDIVDIELTDGCVTAVNVPPHARTVFLWDKKHIECVVRNGHQKKYLNPEEVIHHMNNTGRIMKLTLVGLVADGVQTNVELSSGLWAIGFNTSGGFIESGQGDGGPPEVLVRKPRESAQLTLGELRDDVFELTDGEKTVNIPYTLVRDAWRTASGSIGMLLAAKLVDHDDAMEIYA